MRPTRLSKRSSQSRQAFQDASLSRNQPAETFDTLSTAALPPAYSITLARPAGDADLSDERKAEEYRRGQECLNDGIRRVGDAEGDLRDLVRARKRRRLSWDKGPDGRTHTGELDKGLLWYTASSRHACSCDLRPLLRSFTLRRPPPAREDLPGLPPISGTSDKILLGSDIPEWAGKEDYTDLEPALDALQAFENEWTKATGGIWQSQGIGKFCDALDSDLEDMEETKDVRHAVVLETPEGRWLRKGKFKAIDTLPQPHPLRHEIPDTPDQVQQVVLETPYPPARVEREALQPADEIRQERLDWEQESKRRKQLWRRLIGKDRGYGQFWETLPQPHSYANLGAVADLTRPPDYNLFRNYHTATHPFHPDLSRYTTKVPESRVYWLIPIHGPVIVPGLNDKALSANHRVIERDVPVPSSAAFHTDITAAGIPHGKLCRPAPIAWTASLLNHFVQSFLLPLRQSRLYGLSIAFSGPKPDPFIALVPPTPLTRHQYAGKARLANGQAPKKLVTNGDDDTRPADASTMLNGPARIEAGDHIRLYCDASEALSLRTWLHGVHVDASHGVAAGAQAKGKRMFDKVRLCLIGPRGEVLIVA